MGLKGLEVAELGLNCGDSGVSSLQIRSSIGTEVVRASGIR